MPISRPLDRELLRAEFEGSISVSAVHGVFVVQALRSPYQAFCLRVWSTDECRPSDDDR
jgi:hypothetical protein